MYMDPCSQVFGNCTNLGDSFGNIPNIGALTCVDPPNVPIWIGYQTFKFLQISHYNQNPFKNAVGWGFKNNSKCWRINVYHHFFSFLWFGFKQKKYLSLCRANIFWVYLSKHPSNMGEELVYDHLYHEEAYFYLDFLTQLFNSPFIFIYFISQ